MQDRFGFVESDSKIFEELRQLKLMDWSVAPRLASKYVILKTFEDTNTLIDRSLIDQLFFNDLMYKGLVDYKAPDCNQVMLDTPKYIRLEQELNCKHVLIVNKWKRSIQNVIDKPHFKDSLRFDMFHNLDEYLWGQDDYVSYYHCMYGAPDLTITIEDIYDDSDDPYGEIMEFMKSKFETIL
jgi:hypothetical protein